MSTSTSIKFAAEPVRSLAFGSISGAYMGIGTPLTNPSRQLLLQNFTDQILMFSLNGINDHFPIYILASIILDVTANKSQSGGWWVAEGTRIYVRDLGSAPSVGNVYVSSFYGQ